MSDEAKPTDFWQAYRDLQLSLHSGVNSARPIDAWSQMGETYPGGVKPPESVAAIPAIEQVPIDDPTKKSLDTEPLLQAELMTKSSARGIAQPDELSKALDTSAVLVPVPNTSYEALIKSTLAVPLYLQGRASKNYPAAPEDQEMAVEIVQKSMSCGHCGSSTMRVLDSSASQCLACMRPSIGPDAS